jgi:hypothetical protein
LGGHRGTLEPRIGLDGSDHLLWAARLWSDLDNIRAAVGWALERDEDDEREVALRILAPLEETGRGYPDMGIGALGVQAVPIAQSSVPELRVPVLSLAAWHEWNQGHNDAALALAYDARRDGIVVTTVNPLAPHMGLVAFELARGNHAQSLAIANEVRAELGNLDHPYAEASFLGAMSTFAAMAGEVEQARADSERALELARRSGNIALMSSALHGSAWALQRDDPVAALAAAEEYIKVYRETDVGTGARSSALALAGGLRARLGDDAGALGLLHDAVTNGRDQGVRPQLAAALDWSLSPLLRTGHPDVAATLVGGLTQGSLMGVSDFPGVDTTRARSLERARTVLGDATDAHVASGAAMSYDELVEYAIRNLDPESRA